MSIETKLVVSRDNIGRGFTFDETRKKIDIALGDGLDFDGHLRVRIAPVTPQTLVRPTINATRPSTNTYAFYAPNEMVTCTETYQILDERGVLELGGCVYIKWENANDSSNPPRITFPVNNSFDDARVYREGYVLVDVSPFNFSEILSVQATPRDVNGHAGEGAWARDFTTSSINVGGYAFTTYPLTVDSAENVLGVPVFFTIRGLTAS